MASTNSARSRDLPAADIRKREYVIGIIREVCEKYGFEVLTAENIDPSFQKKIDGDAKSIESSAILAVNETLDRLDIRNFAIYLSHNGVLAGILETVRVARELHELTFDPIRNFSKFNVEGFVGELQEIGVSEKASNILAELFLKTDEILNQEHDINPTVVSNLLNIVNAETLIEIGQILQLTGRAPVLVDPALICESPYSGIVIEARTSGLEGLGSGGCIEEKASGTTGENSTVFAFAFDIENIVDLMEKSNGFPPAVLQSDSAPVL
ncbi:MAG: hypothetical protein ABI999_05190 [Acidobacteriota bacterium]